MLSYPFPRDIRKIVHIVKIAKVNKVVDSDAVPPVVYYEVGDVHTHTVGLPLFFPPRAPLYVGYCVVAAPAPTRTRCDDALVGWP